MLFGTGQQAIAGRNINNLRYADDTMLMAKREEELKSILMKVKEESEKADLKLNIQKMNIMASSPITSWQIDGQTMDTVTDFIFLGSKITADGDCSHEIKRRLLLGRKVMLKNLLQHHSLKASILWCLTFFMVQHSDPYISTGKTIVLTIQTFVSKVISVLFNMLSRFVTDFLPRSKHLLILQLQSLSTVIWGPQNENQSLFSLFPHLFVMK